MRSTASPALRPVLKYSLALSTLGVLVTALIVGLFVHLLLGVSFAEGMLVGAIISSTDAAAVFSILRSKSLSLSGRLRPLLELESGSNDPEGLYPVLTLAMALLTYGLATSLGGNGFLAAYLAGMVAGNLDFLHRRPAAGRAIVELRLPDDFLVVLIARNNEFLVPSGGTILLAEDRLLVLSEQESMRRVEAQWVAPSADEPE